MTKPIKLQDFSGKLNITHCLKAIDSYRTAEKSIAPSKKRKGFEMQMVKLLQRLANGERLSNSSYTSEGNLPEKAGSFYAIKRIPIRGYCWTSTNTQSTIFISHYVFKNKQKLDQKDTDRVCNNWRSQEK